MLKTREEVTLKKLYNEESLVGEAFGVFWYPGEAGSARAAKEHCLK
jgi:hypothetical protein